MSIKSLTCIKGQISKIKSWLQKKGCLVRHNKNEYVFWAGTFERNYITLYTSGKIVFDTKDQEGVKLLMNFEKEVMKYDTPSSQLVGNSIKQKNHVIKINHKGFLAISETPYCIALDESGTGEAFGRVILSGCLISQKMQLAWQDNLQKINTKGGGKRGEDYWFEQQSKIFSWQQHNQTEITPKGSIEYKNIIYALENKLFIRVGIKNKLMDKYYQSKIIAPLLKDYQKKCTDLTKLTIIIDNYALGKNFKAYLQDLEKQGVVVIVITKADDLYVAVRLAAINARIKRAYEIKDFNQPKFMVSGILPGNGNLSISQTKKWLYLWWTKYQKWPWFVKQWFKPTQVISES